MKKKFFIYSLPRSGSAWLSVFFSQPGSFCFHEPLADGSDIVARLDSRPEEIVGAIDTSAYMDPPKFPSDVAIYTLWREWNEIEQSSLRLGFDVDVKEEQKLLVHNIRPLPSNTIRYKDLGNLNYLEVLWKEIVGTPFDRERAEYLVEMQIERSLSAVLKRARR